MTDTAPDIVLRAVLERGLLDRLTALHAETRAALAASLKVTERRPVDFAGTDVGVVSLKRPAVSARVNSDALVAWAKEHRPDEVETVTTYRVRPASEKAWLTTLKAGGSVVSEATGEVLHELPGVTIGIPLADAIAGPDQQLLPLVDDGCDSGWCHT